MELRRRGVVCCVVAGLLAGTLRAEPADIEVESSSGKINIDLTGKWKKGGKAKFSASSGGMTIKVPNSVGVRVNTDTSSGLVKANGFRIMDDDYINDAYNKSDVALNIKAEVSSGSIKLELAD